VDINSVRVTEIEGGDAKLAGLADWRGSRAFSDLERVALEYAERITYTDQKVDDELFARVRKHFGEPQIVELTAAIALENFRSKFNPALEVAAQGFCLLRPKLA
jgi:alkylhydroperoxidase family enzyme